MSTAVYAHFTPFARTLAASFPADSRRMLGINAGEGTGNGSR
jgi:hypothetical protein